MMDARVTSRANATTLPFAAWELVAAGGTVCRTCQRPAICAVRSGRGSVRLLAKPPARHACPDCRWEPSGAAKEGR